MSYNIHKQNDQSKYNYKENEVDSQTYIFELILKDKFNNINTIRRIKQCKQGNIVSSDDNISYNMIKTYKLTVLDVNYPDKSIIIKGTVDHSLTTNTCITNNIYIEINESFNSLLEFNYHINL